MAILFYSHTKGPYVAFSNFSPHPFELDGATTWPTVEHYFQAAKFPTTTGGVVPEALARIASASS